MEQLALNNEEYSGHVEYIINLINIHINIKNIPPKLNILLIRIKSIIRDNPKILYDKEFINGLNKFGIKIINKNN